MKDCPTTLELLAPARDADTAIAAITHGADAVYIGADAFGARAAAGNSVDDIKRISDFAHIYGAKVYVTVNTIIYENELRQVEDMIWSLWKAGADALIVQDLALLGLDLPPIELHASTQTDARTPGKVGLLAQAGFSQIVVPREFSLEQIRVAADAALESCSRIEAFVHGALCVSYSGDCHAGAVLAGRSANRGECPQVCRLSFTLTDHDGKAIAPPDGKSATRHWLSLADMNRLDKLGDMADAGVSSFKIEGRLKNVSYVKNVVAAYSRALDELVASSGGRYVRSSFGRVVHNFKPELDKSFYRGFTGYFITPGKQDTETITSWDTPKWVGTPVATVTGSRGNALCFSPIKGATLSNGDGLGYFTSKGEFAGFRANRVDGNLIFPLSEKKLSIQAGTKLYRNNDTRREALMARSDTASRTLPVNFTLRQVADGRVAIDAADCRGCRVSVVSDTAFTDKAKSPQAASRHGIMHRLGDTAYSLGKLDDRIGDVFMPSKDLTSLRRKAIDALDADWNMVRPRPMRKKPTLPPQAMQGIVLDSHANVANSLAKKFLTDHGARVARMAVEVEPGEGEQRVMTTRYCLRRSLGCCLKTPGADRLPRRLYLDAPIGRLRLEFDCANCNMKIYTNPKYSDSWKKLKFS